MLAGPCGRLIPFARFQGDAPPPGSAGCGLGSAVDNRRIAPPVCLRPASQRLTRRRLTRGDATHAMNARARARLPHPPQGRDAAWAVD
jgi:hypothetical protein